MNYVVCVFDFQPSISFSWFYNATARNLQKLWQGRIIEGTKKQVIQVDFHGYWNELKATAAWKEGDSFWILGLIWKYVFTAIVVLVVSIRLKHVVLMHLLSVNFNRCVYKSQLTLPRCWRCLLSLDFPGTSHVRRAHRRMQAWLPGKQDTHCLQTTKYTAVSGFTASCLIVSSKRHIKSITSVVNLPAGISANLPEISLRASAHRDVESAIMLTL